MYSLARLLLVSLTFVPLHNDVSSESFAGELDRLIAQGSLVDLYSPNFTAHQEELRAFYEASGNRPAWVQRGRVTGRALETIKMLSSAGKKGLNSEDYDGAEWLARVSALQHKGPLIPTRVLAQFDLSLSVCVMRYLSDLHFGRVDSGLYRERHDIGSERTRLAEMVQQVLQAADITPAIERIEPPFDGYRRTLRALQQYRRLMQDNEEILPCTDTPIEPGDRRSSIPRVARMLRNLGDLAPDAALSSDPEIYAGPLVEALKRFQSRHGIEVDGRIGKATLRELNTPLRYRVRQLELTLERWRSIPHEFSRPPVVVNLPEFRLRAYNASYRPELDMKIVAGRAHRHKTPIFAGELKYVIFRPYWNVPLSIQRAELVPKVQRDRSYLAKNGYEIVNAKRAVVTQSNVSDEVLQQLRSGKLSIRQAPGPDNALGLVKFIFPNEHNMYLHDTPARALFARSRRDFSHGCMRVEESEALAVWALAEEPGWSRDRVSAAMKDSKSIRVNLTRPIPVLIVYGTAVVLASGEVRFLQDIYGYDAMLERHLSARHAFIR